MVDEFEIQQLVAMILSVVRPVRVILFGSYARKEAHSESDIDILVAEPMRENELLLILQDEKRTRCSFFIKRHGWRLPKAGAQDRLLLTCEKPKY